MRPIFVFLGTFFEFVTEALMQLSSLVDKMTIADKFRVNPIYYSDYSDTRGL